MQRVLDMWHFTALDKKLRYSDGRVVEEGKTILYSGTPELCVRGLHASRRLIDAIKYAPGPYLWRVDLGGTVIHGEDKSVATERTAIYGFDATVVLKKFSLRVAKDSLIAHYDESKFGKLPAVVMDWLYTGDESIRSAARSAAESAARSAAWSAAESAAESAARSAAWSAAWSAAESAARSAARSAAESAARSAAWSAAWSAAESAAWSAAESAARSAAWSAAESAARSAQNVLIEEMVVAAYCPTAMGKSKSTAKAKASVENGKKGGRPKKCAPVPMQEKDPKC